MKRICIVAIFCASVFQCFSQDYGSFQHKIYTQGVDTLPYRILYPENYDASKKYPLILFLHGAGERGRDNQKQLTHGSTFFNDTGHRKQFPAIVVVPQCSLNDFWARTRITKAMTDSTPFEFEYLGDVPMNKGLNMVSLLLDSMASSTNINNKQIYIGGLSMGGMGTFELLWRKPGFFAAAFPICGGGNPTKSSVYGKGFPIWIFHGNEDPVVDVNDSRKMVAALKASGAKVKYTEYPGVKHDSWKKVFVEPELLSWLFSHKKN